MSLVTLRDKQRLPQRQGIESMKDSTCRCCGCTDSAACLGGCSWVLVDRERKVGICSSCDELINLAVKLIVRRAKRLCAEAKRGKV